MSEPSPPIVKTNSRVFPSAIRYYWLTPLSSGDSPLSSYTLTCSSISYSNSVPFPVSTVIVENLPSSINYNFQVFATNSNGFSSPPATFIPIQTGIKPLPPRNISISTVSSNACLISWSTPTSDGGSAITKYGVYSYPIDANSTILSNVSSLIVKKFTYGNQYSRLLYFNNTLSNYKLNVIALNSVGPSPDRPSDYISFGFDQTVYFSPSNLSGLQLWLDGQDASSLALTAASVNTWTDKSSNAYSVVGTVAPEYNSTTKYITFNGTNQYFTVPNGAFPFGNTMYSIFIVSYTNNATPPQWILGGGTETTPNALGFAYINNVVRHSWWVNEFDTGAVVVNGTSLVIGATYDLTTRNTILNGGAPTSNTPGVARNNPNTPNYIGRRIASTQYLNGGIGEIIYFNSILSPFNRQKVEGYLAWKWGLQANLPTTHPFFGARPTASSVFSPTNFTGLGFWVDATDVLGNGTVLSNGAAVTSWVDKSGSGRTVTGSGPTFSTYQSRNSVLFNLNYLTTTNTINLQNMSMFAVGLSQTNTGNQTVFNMAPTGIPDYQTDAGFGLYYDAGSPPPLQVRLYGGLNGSNRGEMPAVSANGNALDLNIVSYTLSGSNGLSQFFNGATSGTITNPLSNITRGSNANQINIGRSSDGQVLSKANVSELLVYTRALSTGDRQTVEGYLAWKWGLQNNLPTTHPYYNVNPNSLITYNIVTDSLILYLDPGNSASYPGSGTTFFDLSPAKNHCTLQGTPTYSATEHGKFTWGTNNYITTPISSFDKPFTLSFWVKFSSISGWQTFFSQDTSASVLRARFYFQKAGGGYSGSITDYLGFSIVLINDNTITTNASAAATTGVWLNYTVTVSATQVKMYTNGILNNTTNTTQALLTANTNLILNAGYYNNGLVDWISGDTSVFLIYQKALSDSEVLQNYDAMKIKYT